jgi:hypothetical protein
MEPCKLSCMLCVLATATAILGTATTAAAITGLLPMIDVTATTITAVSVILATLVTFAIIATRVVAIVRRLAILLPVPTLLLLLLPCLVTRTMTTIAEDPHLMPLVHQCLLRPLLVLDILILRRLILMLMPRTRLLLCHRHQDRTLPEPMIGVMHLMATAIFHAIARLRLGKIDLRSYTVFPLIFMIGCTEGTLLPETCPRRPRRRVLLRISLLVPDTVTLATARHRLG